MLLLKQFYRNFVTTDLRSPKSIAYNRFILPKGCVIHYVNESENIGPLPDEYPFRHYLKQGWYQENVTHLESRVGRPRELPDVDTLKAIREHRMAHSEYIHRLTVPMHELPDTRIGVINYTPLFSLYRYPKNIHKNYNKYYNILSTVFNRMDNLPKINLLFIDLEESTLKFDAATVSALARMKLDRVKLKVDSLLVSYMIEFMFYILNKESLFNILDDESKATTFFIFKRNGMQICTNLLTMARQFGAIEEIADIVKRRYVTHKVPVMSKAQRFAIIDSLYGATTLEPGATASDTNDSIDVVTDIQAKIATAKVSKEDIEVTDEKHIEQLLTTVISDPMITSNQASSLRKRVKLAQTIPSPLEEDKGKPLRETIKLKEDDYSLKTTTIDHLPDAIPDDLKSTKLKDFDRKYIRDIHKKHILANLYSLNRSGALITDIEHSEEGSILGEVETYRVKFKPIDGAPSTVNIRLPKIHEDGTFLSNGTKYRMTKQHVDLPIRKIDQYEVYLGSNYPSRLAIHRSTKAVDSLERWLAKQLKASEGVDVVIGSVFDHSLKTPTIYGMLSSQFIRITKGKVMLDLTYANQSLYVDEKTVDSLNQKGYVVCGQYGKEPLLIDESNHFLYRQDKKMIELGTVFDLFDLPEAKAPKALATVRSLGKEYPLVIMLLHSLGISKLLKYLDASVIVKPKGKRYKEAYDIRMRFEDVDVYLSELSEIAKMILQGMVKLEKFTKLSTYKDFDKVGVYPPEGVEYLLMELGYPIRYAVEIDLIFKMFLDPITIDTLKAMKEPTNMVDLLIRSVELLTTLDHPGVTDSNYMRERGYERISAMLYKELVKAIRSYKTAYNPKKRNVNIDSYAVFNKIIKDSTVSPTEDANPLGALKEMELVTYLGDGGRSRETMVAKSRVFHESDVGLLSEAVPDSGSTGINAYLSANPKINNLLGMHDLNAENTFASLYSTSFLNTPSLDKDNPMRAVMSHIQQSHVVSMGASRLSPVKTGMEFVIPYLTASMYSNMAEKYGKVTAITKSGLTITYKDGTTNIYPIGSVEGTAEGKIYPHELVTHLKVGDSIKPGDAISYNPRFFEYDPLINQLGYKQGIDIPVALIEGPEVHEDSCGLWEGLSDAVKSPVLYKLDYTIPFNGSVSQLPKIGDKVEAGDILLIIEDEITATASNVKEDNLNTLQDLTKQAPRSKVTGVIHDIEVLYNGKIKDMSPELQKITRASDKRLKRKAVERGEKPYTGETFGELRIKGKVVGSDELVLNIYIKSYNTLYMGDKFVFASQLKATLGKIHTNPIVSESGIKAYGTFSFKAGSARMAPSAFTVPTANRIARYLPIYLAKKHFGKDLSGKTVDYLSND